jgi:hypothetical protein
MSTKVKGDKIKEGSIPLSALSDNVKELLNASVGFKNFCGYLTVDAPLEIPAYSGGSDYYYVKVNNTIVEINIGTNDDITPIPYGPPFSIKYTSDYPNAELSIITDYPQSHRNLKIYVFRGINSNEVFIPDTVLKTTPQTLSDADKNQVLVNLGISEKIDLCKALKSLPIIIDYENPGTFTFEEYGISVEQSNILLSVYLGAMSSYENKQNALDIFIREINIPSYDNGWDTFQFDNSFKIGYERIRNIYDDESGDSYEDSFGYAIDLKNKEVRITRI